MLTLRINGQHKRVFYLKDCQAAEELAKKLKGGSNFWMNHDDQPLSRYKIEESKSLLGKGSFGEVVRAYDTVEKRSVAIKMIKLRKTMEQWEIYHLINEIDIMRVLSEDGHPGIVKIYDVFKVKRSLYIVMEYIEGMSLMQWCFEV